MAIQKKDADVQLKNEKASGSKLLYNIHEATPKPMRIG
jgi:hypothetical protein